MVNVLNVSLFDLDMNQAFRQMLQTVKAGGPRDNKLVSFTGAHGLVTANLDPSFKRTLDNFYWNLPDGKPGVWVGRVKGRKHMQQCPGPNFFELVVRRTANEPAVRHFFCGGKPGVADELKTVCNDLYGNPHIAGTFCPPFRDMSDAEMAQLGRNIEASGATIVWIGLGTPKQEAFATRLKKFTSVHFICTVGAAFDFHTGRVKYAPDWMLHLGLGWFYRTVNEPKRLAGRYMQIIPLFIYFNIRDLFSVITSKNNKTAQA